MWKELVGIGVGGALGAMARFGLGTTVQHWTGPGFPWGTVAVNILGCFVFGLLWTLGFHGRVVLGFEMRFAVFIGFMGAFTTFSSFAFESAELMQRGHLLAAAGNVCLQNVVGIACLFAGIALGQVISGPTQHV